MANLVDLYSGFL